MGARMRAVPFLPEVLAKFDSKGGVHPTLEELTKALAEALDAAIQDWEHQGWRFVRFEQVSANLRVVKKYENYSFGGGVPTSGQVAILERIESPEA